jgi:hypothetical protein
MEQVCAENIKWYPYEHLPARARVAQETGIRGIPKRPAGTDMAGNAI